jgi:putative nucleotidyltransferase with HDIG domain
MLSRSGKLFQRSPAISSITHKFRCLTGPLEGQILTAEEGTTLGREEICDWVILDKKVSRVHGHFSVIDDKLFFHDHDSTNGSFLNGEPIVETELQSGDILRVGATELCYQEDERFQTITFNQGHKNVTNVLEASSIKADSLARKFSEIFEYYRDNQPEQNEAEHYQLVQTQRMVNGLQTIFAVSQTISSLTATGKLLPIIGQALFELFAGAENLAILTTKEDGSIEPQYLQARDEWIIPSLSISRTVLDQAIKEKSTLVANDAPSDLRLAQSDSIIGSSVKSVMCAPLVHNEKVLGAIYLDSRHENIHYDKLDAELLTAFSNQCAIALENTILLETLESHYVQTLQSLINAIEAKDPYTMGHTIRVSQYAVGIARSYPLESEQIERLKWAADLHDIGKIGVTEQIINKPGKLTDSEFTNIKDHVQMGTNILEPISRLKDIIPIIRGHHERWDGSGYPDGLKGEECILEARILALADAFDAMTSKRSYNNPLSFQKAYEKIEEVGGKHFDPQVVAAFKRYLVIMTQSHEESSENEVLS